MEVSTLMFSVQSCSAYSIMGCVVSLTGFKSQAEVLWIATNRVISESTRVPYCDRFLTNRIRHVRT